LRSSLDLVRQEKGLMNEIALASFPCSASVLDVAFWVEIQSSEGSSSLTIQASEVDVRKPNGADDQMGPKIPTSFFVHY